MGHTVHERSELTAPGWPGWGITSISVFKVFSSICSAPLDKDLKIKMDKADLEWTSLSGIHSPGSAVAISAICRLASPVFFVSSFYLMCKK